jgi:hypothetical protein
MVIGPTAGIHHIRKRRTVLSTFESFGVNLLLAVSLFRLTVSYKCMRLSLGLRPTPNMASSNHDPCFPEQPTRLSSLDAMIASRSSHAFTPSLPPLPEQDWDLGWEEHNFIQQNPYAGFEQASATVVDAAANDSTPPQVYEELNQLRNEVRQLSYNISELQDMFRKRLDSMETSILVAQRYVNNLVPWSMEVHDKYSKLLEMVEVQEKRATERTT